jgi:hypothetical protein
MRDSVEITALLAAVYYVFKTIFIAVYLVLGFIAIVLYGLIERVVLLTLQFIKEYKNAKDN